MVSFDGMEICIDETENEFLVFLYIFLVNIQCSYVIGFSNLATHYSTTSLLPIDRNIGIIRYVYPERDGGMASSTILYETFSCI